MSGSVIRLSNNSWICSCESQITDKVQNSLYYNRTFLQISREILHIDFMIMLSNFLKNLMAKLQDKADLKCGEKSAVKFRNKKV